MANVFPPFKLDISGAFCIPCVLKNARQQYKNQQISRDVLQRIEDAEVRSLVDQLKSRNMKVVSDGGFRSRDFLESWQGICAQEDELFFEGSALKITERINLSHHPIFEEFEFLVSVAGSEVLAKQHIPSPAEVMTQILQRVERSQMETVYPDIRILADDIASAYRFLLGKLADAGCRYVQFDGVRSMIMEETINLNNRVLREHPAGIFVAFHAPTDMLIQLRGADAYFLNYDSGFCDRNRLLWFLHEKEAIFGFVLTHYPQEDELDELQAKTENVLNYIPLKHFTLCLPDARAVLSPSDDDEEKQWETLRLGHEMAERIFS